MPTRYLPIVCAMLLSMLIGADRADDDAKPDRREFLRERIRDARRQQDADLKRMTWTVDGVEREALVYFPDGADTSDGDKKYPVLFDFHGHGGSMNQSSRRHAFHKAWPDAICVYPQGLPTPVPKIDPDGKMAGWQKSVGDEKDRDLHFYDAMLKTFTTDHRADAKRVFSAGHSNGAFFTYLLWGARGDTLTAIAPCAGCISVREIKQMKPKPVFHIAGEADPLVSFASQQRSIDKVKDINACPDAGKPAGEHMTEYASKQNAPVITYIHSGGHEFPQEAIPEIVKFFKRF